MVLYMAKVSDLALVGGIGLIAFLVLKGGKDLFNALPTLGGGLGEAGEGILDFGGKAGEGIKDFFGGGIGDSGPITLPSFDLPKLPDLFGGGEPETIPRGDNPLPSGFFGPPASGQPIEVPEFIGPEGNPVITPFGLDDFVNRFNPPTIFGPPRPEGFGEPVIQDTSIPSPFDNQTFQGGGPSFEGGQINEIPIANMSLNDIIERFGVGATEAADIRARARNDFGDFDFGSNTGSGIGSVTENPEIATRLPNEGAVSNPEFEGKTAEQIARELTGGNINNF